MPTAKSTVAIKRIKRPRVPTTAGGFTSDFHKRRVLQAKSLSKIVNPGTASKKNITTGFSVLPENELARNFADGRLATLVTTRTAIWRSAVPSRRSASAKPSGPTRRRRSSGGKITPHGNPGSAAASAAPVGALVDRTACSRTARTCSRTLLVVESL